MARMCDALGAELAFRPEGALISVRPNTSALRALLGADPEGLRDQLASVRTAMVRCLLPGGAAPLALVYTA